MPVMAPERAPAPALQDLHAGVFSTDGLLALLEIPDLLAPRSTGKWIRAAEGGYVELQGFRVDIPAGALAKDTFVTIDLPLTLPEAGYVAAAFGPSGTRFATPVRITLPLEGANLAGIDLETVNVSYWDGSQWLNYGGTATPASVSSTTSHFSTYGARKGGIDTSSGG
jgi:hypothetical protein